MVKILQLFWSFFKIGAFTIGGGYAMIPLMEKELVLRRQWIDKEEFLDILSLSQAMPGIFAVNMATNIGFRLRGIAGAVVSVAGNVMMPILIILCWAAFFHYFRDNTIVDACFKGIRPAVAALIAAPVFKMCKTANITWRNLWIPVAAALLIWGLGISPVWVIVVAGIAGFLYGYFTDRKEEKR